MNLEEAKNRIGEEVVCVGNKNNFSKIEKVRQLKSGMIVAELENGITCNIQVLRDKDGNYFSGE